LQGVQTDTHQEIGYVDRMLGLGDPAGETEFNSGDEKQKSDIVGADVLLVSFACYLHTAHFSKKRRNMPDSFLWIS
jgi:hypothetical protein